MSQVYHQEADPVEAFYRTQGTLVNFEITAGIPETLPGLTRLLNSYAPASRQVTVPAPPMVSAAEARMQRDKASSSVGAEGGKKKAVATA